MSTTTDRSLKPILPVGPIRIDPDAVYTTHAIVLTLIDISSETLSRAVRRGELCGTRRGRQMYISGRALLAWLTSAEAGMGVRP